MTLHVCSTTKVLLAGLLLAVSLLPAQMVNGTPLSVPAPRKLAIKRNATADVPIRVEIRNGYHVNSNKPTEEYMIPLKLEWAAGGLSSAGIQYPAAAMEKYSFSPAPMAVYTSDFTITCKFKAPAAPGAGVVSGKLRYQACTNNMCLPPKTVTVRLPFEVE